MYLDIQPGFSYQAYEARVTEALLKSDHARAADPETSPAERTETHVSVRLAAWWGRLQRRLEPAEEGYLF
jgi:hypothetical protein